MTEAVKEQRRKPLSRNAHVPGYSPQATRKVAQALHDLGGPSTVERVAGKRGVAPAGRFMTQVAAAKNFGFIEKRDGKLVLTSRGEEFLNGDPAAQKKAMRVGVMSTGFAPVLTTLIGRAASVDAIAARLAEDLGLQDDQAGERATVLMKAAEEAGLINDGRFDVAAIEDTAAVVGEVKITAPAPETRARPAKVQNGSTHTGETKQEVKETRQSGSASSAPADPPPAVPVPAVSIEVKIDASTMPPEQVGASVREALKALRHSTEIS